MEAKMNYIKAWQSLPEFGISLFIVKFMGHKKEELLGIAYNRLMRMDIATGDHVKTWRYNTMKVMIVDRCDPTHSIFLSHLPLMKNIV